MALDGVRAEVAGISEQLQRNLARTQLDMLAVRQQLHDLKTTVANNSTVERRVGALTHEAVERVGADTLESIERLGVTVQQGFTMIEARFTSGDRRNYNRNQLAAQLMANPLILALARILYTQGSHPANRFSADRSIKLAELSASALVWRLPREATSPTVIAGTFLLALRANSSNERAAYAILSFLLFLTSRMLELYKSPVMSHIIFVVDLFDTCVEVNIAKATSSIVSRVFAIVHIPFGSPD